MLPLSGDRPPQNADQLARALQEGLRQHGVRATVATEGEWPSLRSLKIDMTSASGSRPLPKLAAKEEITVGSVIVSGQPVEIEGAPAHLHVEFAELRAGFASQESTGWQVVPLAAKSGSVLVEVQRDRLEAALHEAVSKQAEKHGVTVKSTQLELSAPTPRSVRFTVVCTAKVFIASATLTVRGHAEIDESLNAKFSDLTVAGEGMIASMAQGFIQPHLAEWNGRVVPLASYVAGGLALRDVQITTGKTVRIEASLGNAT